MQPQSAADVMKSETGKFSARHRLDIHSILPIPRHRGHIRKVITVVTQQLGDTV